MDSTEKTVLIVGGLGIAAYLVFSLVKNSQANAIAAMNQPGLVYQPSVPTSVPGGTLGSVLSGISIGGTALSGLFSSLGNIGTSNDPGLESGEDDIAYPGDSYTYANSNSYQSGITSSAASDDLSQGIVFDD
jgi:hypothetical protein